MGEWLSGLVHSFTSRSPVMRPSGAGVVTHSPVMFQQMIWLIFVEFLFDLSIIKKSHITLS